MLARAEEAAMRERQRIAKPVVPRRQRERRLEAPPVLLQPVTVRAPRPPVVLAQAVMARPEELLVLPLVVNPTLARLLRERGLGQEAMLVQELLPTTIPTTRAASGPAPGVKTGPPTTTRS